MKSTFHILALSVLWGGFVFADPCREAAANIAWPGVSLVNHGFEVLNVLPPSQSTVDTVLEILKREKGAGRIYFPYRASRVELPAIKVQSETERKALASIADYLEQLSRLANARLKELGLPTSAIQPHNIMLSWNKEGFVHPNPPHKHVDPGIVTVIGTLKGPTTWAFFANAQAQVPFQTPVMVMGEDGARLYQLPRGYHQVPDLSPKPERLFFGIAY